MRRIIVTEFITLDGVVEAPGGNETQHPHRGWQFQYPAPEVRAYKVDELAAVEALLLGRKTYDQFATYWPTQSGGGFADRINGLPKYIVSRSLQQVDWQNSHLLRDVAHEGAALRQTDGGDILVYGSATLAKSLLHHNLIDELRLMVYPLTVGGGLRLWDDGFELKRFSLQRSSALESGVLLLEYKPVVTPL